MASNIVIVSALYPPEPVVSSQLSFDIANLLIEKGNKVTVICPYPSRPEGFDFGSFKREKKTKILRQGLLEIVRVPSFVSPESRLVKRLWESLSFGLFSSSYIKKNLPEAKVVYANTWPLLGQWILSKRLKRLKIPFVLHIQDIYPESLLEKLPDLIRGTCSGFLRNFDRQIANNSRLLAVVSENMKRTYMTTRAIPEEKILLVQNWQDERPFLNLYKEQPEKEAGITFMFLGNIGPVAGVDVVIQGFHNAAIPGSQLIIAGNGSERGNCENLVSNLKASNISFHTIPGGVEEVADMQAKADVLLLPIRKKAAMSSIPSKLIAYMFSGKPIIATVDSTSDTADAIMRAKCGWTGEPENIEWLSDKMKEVSAFSRNTLEDLGRNGLEFGLQNYSRKHGCEKLCNAIMQVADGE